MFRELHVQLFVFFYILLAQAKSAIMMLKRCRWLPGCCWFVDMEWLEYCYAVARVFRVVARGLLYCF